MNVTSRQLKAFLLTARHQSFSRAAEQLFITQSGMSMLIRELEAQLGFRLFERTTRRVTLTPSGAQFLPTAEKSLLGLEAAATSIGRSATAARRRLAIGAMPLIAGKLLPAAIAEYARRDPGLQMELRDGDRKQLIAGVDSGELDMAIGCFLQPVPGLQRKSLYRFTLMLVQPPAEAALLARAPRWDDLADRRLLGGPSESPLQQMIEHQLQRLRRHEAPVMRLNYFETQISMVEAGAGSAVLPSFCLPACRGRKVATAELTDPVVPVDLMQIVRRGRELPCAAEFGAFLASHIAGWMEPWTPGFERAA
ncbi:MAG TPA: LysR family transcriptional regulator [Burkholderiales bacterium]|nr:LysR family transcriptional regulator [Burkholderiales bacterium]